VATINVLGSQASFAPFGTHFFGGPIYDATVNLEPFNITLDPNRNYVIGFTVFNAGDVGVLETSQLGASDRGLSPFYPNTGWRFMNTFEGLDVGRYAVALHGTVVPSPGAAGLFGVAALAGLRRRRR
jgi:MYXO-CTERM domain-containing protein